MGTKEVLEISSMRSFQYTGEPFSPGATQLCAVKLCNDSETANGGQRTYKSRMLPNFEAAAAMQDLLQ